MVDVRLERISATFHHPVRGPLAVVREIDLHAHSGELLTLLGPSGCGKTTTLRMIAGFQPPSAGRLFIGDQDVTAVRANRRDIGFVFQNYALFPHLSVRENIAYGLRVRRQSAGEIAANVEKVLRLVDLARFEARLPHELSGGQQQRVALARAIVIQPRVLLFDEPLSNLDAQLRVQMRGEIRALQQALGTTTIYVTHDQEEAMAISDRIAVMEEGRIAQCDRAEVLYRRPVSAFVAGFLGRTNLLDAVVIGQDNEQMVVEIAGQRVTAEASAAFAPGTPVRVMVRPEAVGIDATRGQLPAMVVTGTYLGDKVEYAVRLGEQLVQIVRYDPPEDERFAPGAKVALSLPARGMRVLPAG